jgi:hypothetical protein
VDDALVVRGAEGAADLPGHVHRAPHRQRPELAERRERAAREELHDEEGRAVGQVAHVGHVDDVIVADQRGGARLALEALDDVAVTRVLAVQALERDLLADEEVLGLVDATHAADAEDLGDPVTVGDDDPDALVVIGRTLFGDLCFRLSCHGDGAYSTRPPRRIGI